MNFIFKVANKRKNANVSIQLDEHRYYLVGDTIPGKVIVESPKSFKITRIRITWLGRVRLQIEPTIHDVCEIFKKTHVLDLKALSPDATPGIGFPPSSSSNQLFLIEAQKKYAFPFSVKVPKGSKLPSCTESESNMGGIVEYIVEVKIEKPATDFSDSLKTQLRVPILQKLDTSAAKFQSPQTAQCWSNNNTSDNNRPLLSLSSTPEGHRDIILRAAVPKKVYTRNQPLPVTIDVEHIKPYKKADGLNISLVCSVCVVVRGVSYVLPDSIVHHIKADVDVSVENGLAQTITRSLLIPSTITPTIGINSWLLEVSYKVRVVAELQDLLDTVTDTQLTEVEIPIDIGTLPLLPNHVPPIVLCPEFVTSDKYIHTDREEKARANAEGNEVRARMAKESVGRAPENVSKGSSIDSSNGPSSTITGPNTFTESAASFAFPPPPDTPPPKVEDLIGLLALDMGPTTLMDAIEGTLTERTDSNSDAEKKRSITPSMQFLHTEPRVKPILDENDRRPPPRVRGSMTPQPPPSLSPQPQVSAELDLGKKKSFDNIMFTFNIFPDSDLSDGEDQKGDKPTSKPNEPCTGDVTVRRLNHAPKIVNKPHEIPESESEYSDEEELLDILSRRDKRLARHING